MPIDKYHPAFKKIVRYSCYPDNLFVREPESNYRAIPNDPIEGYMWYKDHGGLDAYSSWGSPIYSAADGVVVEIGRFQNGTYGWIPSGNYVAIKTDGCIGCEGVASYKHLMDFSVVVGQRVKAGQQIGRQGDSGAPGAHHLHFDYFIDKVRHDPVPYLEGRKSFIIAEPQEEPSVNIKVDARYKYIDTGKQNIRADKSVKSADIGDITPQSEFNVDIIADNEGYTWGHIPDVGWTVLYNGGVAWCVPVVKNDGSAEIARLNSVVTQKESTIVDLNKKITNARTALG